MVDKKEKLLDSGKQLFSTKGFKDTSVADITKTAGVATGTFYLYYPSKEELFMEIYLEENEKLKRAIMETVDPDGDPLAVLLELMQKNMQGMAANPILREWYNKDIFNKIEAKFRQQNGLDQVDFVYQSFIEIIKKWQNDGKMRRDIDSEMIMALFSVVVIVDLHKEEIGFQYFPKIQEYLTEFIMNGLRGCSGQSSAGEKTEG
jgi:AcrR family transcriptional regulator